MSDSDLFAGAIDGYKEEVKKLTVAFRSFGDGRVRQFESIQESFAELEKSYEQLEDEYNFIASHNSNLRSIIERANTAIVKMLHGPGKCECDTCDCLRRILFITDREAILDTANVKPGAKKQRLVGRRVDDA